MIKKALAIITARGGSKRVPYKNIKDFLGQPIMCYSIKAAQEAKIFDEIMVSTDDQLIKKIALEAGATVPFMRSARTSDDFATTDEVIMEVLTEYKRRGIEFERFFCIYPTAPFLTAAKLQAAMIGLNEADSIMPVVEFSYPPQRGLVIRDGRLKRCYPEYAETRSQDLETVYHDCGQFYACNTAAFLKAGTTDVANLKPLPLSGLEVQDIDTEADWQIAELKYKRMKEYHVSNINNPIF